jgi:hypothetical protein
VSARGLKYEPIARRKHGLPNKTQGQTWLAQRLGQFLNHLGLGVPLRVLPKHRDFGDTHSDGVATGNYRYWRGRNIGRSIPFFIERWENERAKPKFEVIISKDPPTPVEILLHLRDGQAKRTVCFFEVSLRNTGVKTAEKIVPIVAIPAIGTLGVPLIFVSRPPLPHTEINTPWSVKDFNEDYVASGIVEHVGIRQVDLYGGGVGQTFALFFTLSNADKIYLPCESKVGLRLPAKFQIALSFQAKDMPLVHYGVFQVDAKAWNDVTITVLPSDLLQSLATSVAGADRVRTLL